MAEQIRRENEQNGRFQNQLIDNLLTNNQYELLQNVLYQLLKQAEADNDKAKVSILAAAYQICLSCNQQYHDIATYKRSYEDAVAREYALHQHLGALMKIVDEKETAVILHNCTAEPNLSDHRNMQESFWQRLQKLFHKTPFYSAQDTLQTAEKSVQSSSVPASPLMPPATLQAQTEGLRQNAHEKEKIAAAKDQPHLTIYCLGTFQAFEDEHLIEEWPSKKGKAIFKYLLLHRQQQVAKEVLMDMFWPDSDEDAARNNLNVAIYGLRQALRNGYPEFSHVLFQDDRYLLNPEMTIWIDVDAFNHCLGQARSLLTQGDEDAAIHEYHAAEALYQDEFLAEDRYEEWVIPIRQSLQEKYLQLLSTLSDYYYERGSYATSIEFCQKTLDIEACQEKVHRRLMRAYCHLGQDYLALRQYHQCATLLQNELEITPEKRTSQLYESIRQRDPSIFSA